MYFQAYRTSAYRRAMNFIHEQIISQMKERKYEEKYCKSFTYAVGMQYGENYYQISRLFNRKNISDFIIFNLNEYNWLIGKVNGSLGLLTSDDPAILFLSKLPNWCFPITPKLALIFCDKNSNTSLKHNCTNTIFMTSEDVVKCNGINLSPTIRYKYVFGALSDLELIKPIILKFDNNFKPLF